eukprot:747175-Hanusia_phi.AAC.5
MAGIAQVLSGLQEMVRKSSRRSSRRSCSRIRTGSKSRRSSGSRTRGREGAGAGEEQSRIGVVCGFSCKS